MFRNIVAGIIVLILSGVLVLVITNILGGAGEIADRETCRTSVLMKAQTKIMGESLYENINCKTEVHEVKSTNEEEIYKFIAYRMYDCWYQFAEGEKDFLGNLDIGNSDEWCWICSRIDFDENVQKKYPEIKMEDFHNYLKTESLPLEEESTFYEYFYGETPGKIEGNMDNPSLIWKTDDPLYVSFLADHNRKYDTAFWVELATGAGMVVLCAGSIMAAIGTLGGGGITAGSAAVICAKATTVAAVSFTMMAGVKGDYLMGLDVSSAKDTTSWCNTNR